MKRICSLLFTVLTSICSAQTETKKIINPEGKTPFPYNHSVDNGLQDKAGNIWFGTSEGIYRYDGKLFTNYTTIAGLNAISLPGIVADKAGNIWFGMQGGAVRYDPSASPRAGAQSFAGIQMRAANIFGFLSPAEQANAKKWGLDENPYVEIFPDRSGNIWFCRGFDLLRYDEKSRSAMQTGLGNYLKSEVMPYDSIRRDATIHLTYQDKKGNIWFRIGGCSTPLHETYRLEAGRVNNPCVLNTCSHDLHNPNDRTAHNKEIASSITRITRKDGINSIEYRSILEDKRGNMWFGTYDSGLYSYDGKFLTHFSNKDGLGTSSVGVIYEDKTGNIWFGTGDRNQMGGNGVFRYNGKSMAHFTTKDGLCNTGPFRNMMITSITEDNKGNIWFGGFGGVCHYDGKTFTNFTKQDGSNEQPVNFVLKEKAGDLWFGTWDLGLYRYDGKSYTNFTEQAVN